MFIFTIINIWLINTYFRNGTDIEPQILNIMGISIVIFQTLFLSYIINISYTSPIKKLTQNIKRTILTKEKIEFEKTINPNITYINTFFIEFLNSFKNIKNDFLRGKVISSEVELAKEIQEKLLNKKITPPPSLNIVARSKPMGEIGGDSFDIIQNKDNYYIYIGDATGHGVGAGFIMVMVNALIEGMTKFFVSGGSVLVKTNEILKPRIKANLLMSTLLLRWNEVEKRLFMTGAGHEYLLIYKDKLQKCFKIKSGGLALGMMKNIEKLIKENEIKFEENDIVVLYSDGVTDAINSNDNSEIKERFGEDRLVKAIEKAPNLMGKGYKTAQGVFNNITLNLSRFMGYKPFQVDDVTLVVIQYKPKDYIETNDFNENIFNDESVITEWKW
ncbi:MAG: PP2C family protein-serine/threonine phosphatase [Candidatus Gracilibacteria bacterium]|nr:PP2C family protein-serine/threonine phosphatase [Candidatus Gracilibacteria bacterium]